MYGIAVPKGVWRNRSHRKCDALFFGPFNRRLQPVTLRLLARHKGISALNKKSLGVRANASLIRARIVALQTDRAT
jgi:hypothetical protein